MVKAASAIYLMYYWNMLHLLHSFAPGRRVAHRHEYTVGENSKHDDHAK